MSSVGDVKASNFHIFDEQTKLVNMAVHKIFSSMFSQDVSELDLAPDKSLWQEGAVLALISLVGDVELSIWLGFPAAVASGSTKAFIGVEIDFEEVEDIADAVGEVANMVAGDVKASLSAHGIKTVISLPNVITGKEIRILSSGDNPRQETRFKSQWGDFWVQVAAGVEEGETRAVGT
jgi:chemotaxis protein CheX